MGGVHFEDKDDASELYYLDKYDLICRSNIFLTFKINNCELFSSHGLFFNRMFYDFVVPFWSMFGL